VWILGDRPDQNVVAIEITSADNGSPLYWYNDLGR
jgi:hypothetical protein